MKSRSHRLRPLHALGTTGAAWSDALRNVSAELHTDVRTVSITDIDAAPEEVARLRAVCGIEGDGALLVRPDGHVAWRHERMAPDPIVALTAAFGSVGVQ